MKYKINKELFRKIKERGGICLCEKQYCPCDEFLDKDICKCKVFELCKN